MKKELTTTIVRELLDYDQHTGEFTWKARERHWFKSEGSFKRWNNRFAGRFAGTISKGMRGYQHLSIGVLGKLHKAHRLAFIYMGEALPDQVDHLNRDSLDNSWENLSASSARENMKNKSMFSNNTSGVTGVIWHKARDKWMARVNLGGRLKHLGLFTDLEEATEVVRAAREAEGYSVGHGAKHANYTLATPNISL